MFAISHILRVLRLLPDARFDRPLALTILGSHVASFALFFCGVFGAYSVQGRLVPACSGPWCVHIFTDWLLVYFGGLPRLNRTLWGLRNLKLFHEILHLTLVLFTGYNLLNPIVFPPSDMSYYLFGIHHEYFLTDVPQMAVCLSLITSYRIGYMLIIWNECASIHAYPDSLLAFAAPWLA